MPLFTITMDIERLIEIISYYTTTIDAALSNIVNNNATTYVLIMLSVSLYMGCNTVYA